MSHWKSWTPCSRTLNVGGRSRLHSSALAACLALLLSSFFLSLHVAIAAEKVTAKLFVPDALTLPDRPVKLEARVLQDALVVRSGLGGEQLEFLVGGKRVGTAMTGGDGPGCLG